MTVNYYSWEELSKLPQQELERIKEEKQRQLLLVQEEKGTVISNILYLQDVIRKERA